MWKGNVCFLHVIDEVDWRSKRPGSWWRVMAANPVSVQLLFWWDLAFEDLWPWLNSLISSFFLLQITLWYRRICLHSASFISSPGTLDLEQLDWHKIKNTSILIKFALNKAIVCIYCMYYIWIQLQQLFFKRQVLKLESVLKHSRLFLFCPLKI